MNNLKEIIDGLTIEVDQDFMDWKAELKWKASAKNGHDFLLLEYYLLKTKQVVKIDDNIVYDFVFENRKYDVKIVPATCHLNQISRGKKSWWEAEAKAGNLTHFLFVHRTVNGTKHSKKKLKLGDIVEFTYVSIHKATDIIERVAPSQFDFGKTDYVHGGLIGKDLFKATKLKGEGKGLIQVDLPKGAKVWFLEDRTYISMRFLKMKGPYGTWSLAGGTLAGNYYGTFHHNASQDYYLYEPSDED